MKRLLLLATILVASLSALCQSPVLQPKQDAKKPLWGYVNPNTDKWVVKPRYDVAEPFKQGPDGKYRALVTKGNLQGFIGPDGKLLGAGLVFEAIEPIMHGNNLIVTVKGKRGVVSPDAVYVIKPELTDMVPLGAEGYIVDKNGKKGFIDPTGRLLIPMLYSNIKTEYKDIFVVKKGGKEGIVSRSGEMLLEPKEYSSVKPFGSYWKVYKGDKVGLQQLSPAQLLVDPKYAEVGEPLRYSKGAIFPVRKSNGKWGAVDDKGKECIKCKNQAMTTVSALGMMHVYRNGVGHRLWSPVYNVFLEMSNWKESNNGPFKVYSGTVDIPSNSWADDKISYLSLGEYVSYSDKQGERLRAYNSLSDKSFTLVVDKDGNNIGVDGAWIKSLGDNWLVGNRSVETPISLYDAEGRKLRTTSLRGSMVRPSPTNKWLACNKRIIFSDLTEADFMDCGDLLFTRPTGSNTWYRLTDYEVDTSEGFEKVLQIDKQLANVRQNGKWGVYADGGLKMPCEYPYPMRKAPIDGYLLSGNRGAISLYSDTGQQLISDCDSIYAFDRKGYLVVERDCYLGLFNTNKNNWVLPLDRKYTSFSSVDEDSETSDFWISCGNLNGVADAGGDELIRPAYGDITYLNYLSMYCCEKGSSKTYFNQDGTRAKITPHARFTNTNREGDYYKDYVKGEMQSVDFECYFLKGHRIKVIVQVFNSNGTPARLVTVDGKSRVESIYTPDYEVSPFTDHKFFVPYDCFPRYRHTSKNYYVKYTLIDVTAGGKVLDTVKIPFGVIWS